jgi:hypothetical protein
MLYLQDGQPARNGTSLQGHTGLHILLRSFKRQGGVPWCPAKLCCRMPGG